MDSQKQANIENKSIDCRPIFTGNMMIENLYY